MGRKEREQLDELIGALRDLNHKTESMHTVLMIREPETVTAATAYEGLRKQIIASSGDRRAHLTQLAQMDSMLNHTDDVASLRRVSQEWLEQAGITRVDAPPGGGQVDELFEVVEESGQQFTVLQPAYVDQQSGRVLKRGSAAFVAGQEAPRPNHQEHA